MSRGSSCVSASSSSTSNAVDCALVFVVRRIVSVRMPSLSNRISDSFFGELMLNSSPASSKMRPGEARELLIDAPGLRGERRRVDPHAGALDRRRAPG